MDYHKFRSLIILLLVLTVMSCDRYRVFDQSIDIDEKGWDQKDAIVLETEIADTMTLHKIFVNIRNTTDYSFSNIYLFVKTIFPNGRVARDTLQGILADKEGKWLGKGIGKIRDNQILIMKDIRFPYQGLYVFEIEQAMRIKILPGIKDVGLRIEKQSSN